MSDRIEPQDGFEADRILTEQGRWVHINRPVDAPKAPMFGGGEIIPDPGPTLRDQFAMAALTGLMQGLPQGWGNDIDQIATDRCSDAYIFADAMLAERERAK